MYTAETPQQVLRKIKNKRSSGISTLFYNANDKPPALIRHSLCPSAEEKSVKRPVLEVAATQVSILGLTGNRIKWLGYLT